MSAISKEKRYCYILGDFNFDILRHSSHSQTGNFLSVMYSNGLQPLITKPTRVTASSCTCIDNIFTNVLNKTVYSGVLYCDVSDHLPIFQLTEFVRMQDCTSHPTTNDSVFSKLNYENVSRDLSLKNWFCVNSAYEAFLHTLSGICKKHANVNASFQRKNRDIPRKPWITQGILCSINKKQRLFRKYITNPSCKNRFIIQKL